MIIFALNISLYRIPNIGLKTLWLLSSLKRTDLGNQRYFQARATSEIDISMVRPLPCTYSSSVFLRIVLPLQRFAQILYPACPRLRCRKRQHNSFEQKGLKNLDINDLEIFEKYRRAHILSTL